MSGGSVFVFDFFAHKGHQLLNPKIKVTRDYLDKSKKYLISQNIKETKGTKLMWNTHLYPSEITLSSLQFYSEFKNQDGGHNVSMTTKDRGEDWQENNDDRHIEILP